MPTEPSSADAKMIERLLREGCVPVSRAVALAPPSCRGKARSPYTLVRWIEDGKRGVRLEGFYGADKCWWTSAGALARFFARLTDMKLAGRGFRPTSVCADEAEAADRQRRAKAANEEMDRLFGRRKPSTSAAEDGAESEAVRRSARAAEAEWAKIER